MGSFLFPDLPELIRQNQLLKNLNLKPQVGSGPVASQVQTPAANVPGDQKTVGPASQAYQTALGQQAPQISDYHPSLGRRIAGALLGGIAGAHDANSGIKTGHAVAYAPFDKQMTDYQNNLGRLKITAEGEQKGNEESAKLGELGARAEAERERAGAEEARKKTYQFQVEHPESRYKPTPKQVFELKLKDGTPTIGIFDPIKGIMSNADGEEIKKEDIAESNVYKPGVQKSPQQFLDKGTGNLITGGEKPTSAHVEEPAPKEIKETPTEKNAEWDRRNKIQFDQQLKKSRILFADSLRRQENSAKLRTNQPAAQTRATAEFAKTVEDFAPKITQQVDNLKDKIGPGEGRWNQLWVNKGGMNDPDFAGLDQDLKMYASAITRIHFGLRGGQTIVGELQKNFSEAQSPEDLKSRINHANEWVKSYAAMKGIKPEGEEPKKKDVLPGGVTLDEINQELERRKKGGNE